MVKDLGEKMPLVQGASAPKFSLPHATFTGLAAPSRGSSENSVWRVELAPHAEPVPHSLSREEIFIAVSGKALATVGGEQHEVTPGDALIVPAGQTLSLANPHPEPFAAVCVFPVGGQAKTAEGEVITPPWAA